eukprot:Colp12_sorted_trinity150504_noHs@21402
MSSYGRSLGLGTSPLMQGKQELDKIAKQLDSESHQKKSSTPQPQPPRFDGTPQNTTIGFVIQEPSGKNIATSADSTPQDSDKKTKGQESDKKAKAQDSDKKGKGGAAPQFVQPPKKITTKAERRAIQEKQRAEKAAKSGEQGAEKTKEQTNLTAMKRTSITSSENIPTTVKKDAPKPPSTNPQEDDTKYQAKKAKQLAKHQLAQRTVAQKIVDWFSHLPQYERELSLTADFKMQKGVIHPAILQLGLQYAQHRIIGSTARCLALLNAFKRLFQDYKCPPNKELRADLLSNISAEISFLKQCRPLSFSIGNIIRFLKYEISRCPPELSDEDAIAELITKVDKFILERISLAGEAISKYACSKIKDGDVILTYANSYVVQRALVDAHSEGKKFKVIVVDSRPLNEGKETVRRLAKHGISCTYVLINAISYVMKEVTKVMVGAHALTANGQTISRVGTAQVAMMAKVGYRVPVLVCCETFKFSQRALTDSFVHNELGDPQDLVDTKRGHKDSPLKEWRDVPQLKLLNLYYDVTPSEFVDLVITEVGMIPTTSVPVVLREYMSYTAQMGV